MTDRESFLKAILEDRRNDTIRLAYADWLQENGSGDVDAATAEFIRASCRIGGAYNLMAKPAYEWLEGNWKRLVPTLLTAHAGYDAEYPRINRLRGEFRLEVRVADQGLLWARRGRQVEFCGVGPVQLDPYKPAEAGRTVRMRFRARLGFWKGFLVYWRAWASTLSILSFRKLVAADQPMLELNHNFQISI